MIYKRFTEKAAEEWRQIYKVGDILSLLSWILPLTAIQGLQLLEFLIKNGSERVIDDARGHLSLLKMLRQFQFIDQNGKDQGVNVRNRAKELAELLGDVDRIRAERKKARANRNKFGGVEGGGGMSGSMSGSSRYGGFGSEDAGFGGYSGGTYGGGGGFGGNTSSGFQDSGASGSNARRDRFEEYDEEDDGTASTTARRKADPMPSSSAKKKAEPKKAPEVDLFEFGDDEAPPMTPPKPAAGNGMQSLTSTTKVGHAAADDDEFDDFISAPSTTQASNISRPTIPGLAVPPLASSVASSTQFAAPKPVSAAQGINMNDLVGFSSISPAPSNHTLSSTPLSAFSSPPPPVQNPYQQMQPQAPRPTGYQAAQPNYFTSVPAAASTTSLGGPATTKPGLTSSSSFSNKPAAKSTSGGDAFGSLWSSASAQAGIKKTTPSNQGPKLADMAKEKATQGIWGATAASSRMAAPAVHQQQQGPGQGSMQGPKIGGGLDDLLG
jgi:epsin